MTDVVEIEPTGQALTKPSWVRIWISYRARTCVDCCFTFCLSDCCFQYVFLLCFCVAYLISMSFLFSLSVGSVVKVFVSRESVCREGVVCMS